MTAHHPWIQGDDPSTDWDAVWRDKDPRLTEMHRGIRLYPDLDVWQHANDASRPVDERAHALLRHVGDQMREQGRGIGMSWTDSPQHAEHAARAGGLAGWADEPKPRPAGREDSAFRMPVVFHAAWPEREHIETDPQVLSRNVVTPYDKSTEGEIPIRHGAPVRLTGISWARSDGERDKMTHHQFASPVTYNGTGFEHTAARHPGQDENGEWFYGEKPAHLADDLPPEMHRGVGMWLPQELHDHLRDESVPAADRAQALLGHLDEHSAKQARYGGGGLGIHWSTKEKSALGFATRYDQRNHKPMDFVHDPLVTRIVFHAQTADPAQMLRSKRKLDEHSIFGINHGEGEIPLKKRSRVHLNGISWGENAKDAPLTRFDFPQQIRRTAGIHSDPEPGEYAPDPLGHFEAANQEGGEMPDLSAHFPHAQVSWQRHPDSPPRDPSTPQGLLDDLLSGVGGRDERHSPAQRGQDAPDSDRPTFGGQDLGSMTPPPGSRPGDSPFIPAGHRENAPVERMKSLWDYAHYPNSGYSEEARTALRARFRDDWRKAGGLFDCQHSQCPPWQCREKRTAALLDHFEGAARPGRGEKACGCCKGNGIHGDGTDCTACGGNGALGKDDPGTRCPSQPQPRRRHWREKRAMAGSWYHGTPEELEPGAELRPGDEIGKKHMGRGSDSAHIWISNDPWRASSYGLHIYEVRPHDQPKAPHSGSDEHTTSGATVIREVPYQEATATSAAYQAGAQAYAKQQGIQAEAAMDEDKSELLGHFEAAGMIDLYHHTSPEIAAKIYREKKMTSKENTGSIFFTTDPDSEYAAGFGEGVVHVRMPRAHLDRLDERGKAWQDDEFPSGEQHWAIHHTGVRPEHFVAPGGVTASAHQAAGPDDYGILHRPDVGGPPLHDLTDSSGTDWGMPKDIYERMHEYNTYSHDPGLLGEAAWKAMGKIQKFRGQPEKRVRIWRAAPAVNPESRNGKRGEINHGDWVGLSREKALSESYEVNDPPHGSLPANHPNRYHIWSALVPAKHVRNADGDLTEWGYAGPDIKDIPHHSETCSHRARVQPREAVMDKQAAGETAPEGHQIWAVPAEGRSPVAAEVYHNMTTREPEDEHGSAWYRGISYHGPYHVIRHPQTRQVWLVDRHGRDASPTGGHYGNPERDGSWGEQQAWGHQHGLESAGPEAHRFGTPDEPRLNLMNERTPEFPHSRVDPEDEERVRRPEPRVHAPEGYSPSDEYHGSYEVVRHPESGRYHVIDNAGRHATTGNWNGFDTQLKAERSRDYTEKRQQSKERARGIADSIWEGGHEVLDPGGTAESRQSEENVATASDMMRRYEGGLGEIKFDPDEEGGAPYYEREHLLGSGQPSGWYAKHYGGAHTDVYHRATGDESHALLHLPQHPEDEDRSMTPRLHPQFGDEHLARELSDWHDDPEDSTRSYLEENDPRISRWKRRHLGAAHEVVAHFEDPEPRPFTAAAVPEGGEGSLPSDPGTAPIPEGHVRLWHYTPLENVPSIREHGLQRRFARGDAGNGDLHDPSAGMWASTAPPHELLNSHDSAKAVVEFHAHPREISANAESPWHAELKREPGQDWEDRRYDPDQLREWAEGNHHVIMHGDVPRQNILAIHEPWHAAARYMRNDDPTLHEYQWVKDDYAKGGNDHLEPYVRGLRALEGSLVVAHFEEPMTLYRGLHFGYGTSEEADRLHANPAEHLHHKAGVGIHWTANPDSAWNFAQDRDPEGWAHEHGGPDEEDEGPQHSLGMILHGEVHPRHVVQPGTDEWEDYSMSDAVLDPDHAEQETTLRADAPVKITHLTTTSVDPDGHVREVTHPYGMTHTASAEVVAHFEQPKLAAGPYYQQKLFHMQPDPTRHEPASMRHNPVDPEAGYRHRKEHDEEYQPDECPECGGDRHFREQHEEEHAAHLEGEDWYTDWDGMDMPSHIHRGMAVHLPQELHDYVHDESRPAADRATALARHLAGEPGSPNNLGHYWSESPDQSKGYAEHAPSWLRPGKGEAPQHTPVMVHARFPGREHIETDPDTLKDWKVLKYGYGRDNLEYPISEDAPIHLSGVSWARPGHKHPNYELPLAHDPAWTHHEFGEHGIQANATLATAAFDDEDGREERNRFIHPEAECPHCGEPASGEKGADAVTFTLDSDRRGGTPEPVPSTIARCNNCGEMYQAAKSGEQTRVDREAAEMNHAEYEKGRIEGGELFKHFTPHPTHPMLGWDGARDVINQARRDEQQFGGPGAFALPQDNPMAQQIRRNRFNRVLTDPNASRPVELRRPEEDISRMSALQPGPDQRSAAEGRGDRWHEYKNNNDHLHRGIFVRLPEDLHRYVHDDAEPREERAHALQEHFARSGEGLGMHWTPHPQIAQRAIWNAAEGDESSHGAYAGDHGRDDDDDWYGEDDRYDPFGEHDDEDEPGSPHTEVMFHATTGQRNKLPEREHEQYGIGWAHSHDEDEFPVRPGSPMRLHGISWKQHEPQHPNEPFEHVDFPKPMRHVSSAAPAAIEVVAHFEAALEPQGGEDMWRHLQEMHGVKGDRVPGTDFMNGLHDRFHAGQTADLRRVPHSHDAPDARPAGQSNAEAVSRMFTPIPDEELEAQRKAREPKPERLDDREYSINDVSRHYDWEGFGSHEIAHLVHRPEHAVFTKEDIPVKSLRLIDQHGALTPPHSYQDIAGQAEDEQDRLNELERGIDNDEPVPPIVAVRDGEHHIIADGSHRAAIYARQRRTHIPAFVTQRTIFPEQHTASVTAAYDWETDEGPYTWEEIGDRYPHIYGEDSGDSDGIGGAASHLYHDRPGHSQEDGTSDEYVDDMEFHPRTVDPSRIDYMRSEPGDPRVRRAREGYESQRPERVPPLILVHRHGVFMPADGHHRSEGADRARKPVRAYVAYSPHEHEPFSDGERGPFHGASTEEAPAWPDQNGVRRRISYPGFPHTAEVPRPDTGHTASKIRYIAVYDRAALPQVPASSFTGLEDMTAEDAREMAAGFGDLMAAIREGLLRVARTAEEALPLHPSIPEMVRDMAASCALAERETRRPPAAPEASWEEPGHPNL